MDEFVEIEVCYHGHSASGGAVFLSLEDDPEADTVPFPVSCVNENSLPDLENASRYDVITIEVKESMATEKGLI